MVARLGVQSDKRDLGFVYSRAAVGMRRSNGAPAFGPGFIQRYHTTALGKYPRLIDAVQDHAAPRPLSFTRQNPINSNFAGLDSPRARLTPHVPPE